MVAPYSKAAIAQKSSDLALLQNTENYPMQPQKHLLNCNMKDFPGLLVLLGKPGELQYGVGSFLPAESSSFSQWITNFH